ncbi:MAG: ABC transporter related protein [Candidatus Daviesbacteria bacterium GW2011_GWA1_41_61]|uniref:ABC transporter related protein n=1 Tax=Candidatus Daviesbacteria bacterium GW2011_GWA2_40_9 TaxID=1618424 RepID=A0A0G0U3T2_9BACT|nr:MAG: ABC transporter related protein [Candidatus Daviesbacteria bacterium GW2011_GWA2_40_9]KKR93696.1 MAG: ABC transporter related protein [Candidatus Daviesbacteria bacterium GW2011_GWB1_41_15]KKS15162.1 MAG: ABC transporter related protein [Candidatus Daviesbacteria bacterium GW2011_GWA1_41_61]
MSNNSAIKFNNVSKKFRKGQKLFLKEALVDLFRPKGKGDFWALKDVSFQINKGESVGIIGTNGSGKSTILKLIAGVLKPTQGKITVEGRISPLIELGAGFHPELTGRENIYLNGTILGLSKKEIEEKFAEIVEFSGLGDFIDTPIKHYSSGMYMRLGFSIAVHTNPDILIIDEILAVGDMAFQNKCFGKINQFKDQGVTIIFVSHSMEAVRNVCNKVLLIYDGRLILTGTSDKVITGYLESINTQTREDNKGLDKDDLRRGDGKAKIIDVRTEDKKGSKRNLFAEEIIRISFKVKFLEDATDPIFGIVIKTSDDKVAMTSNTHLLGIKTGNFKKGTEKIVSWEFKNYWDNGRYSISPAVAYKNGLNFYTWRENSAFFSVKKPYSTGSLLNFPHFINIK